MEKKASVVVEGEDLNVLIGSRPLKGEEKDAVKKQMTDLLKEEYNIEEEDFLSAEIEVVPAGRARDFGLTGAWSFPTVRTTESVPLLLLRQC